MRNRTLKLRGFLSKNSLPSDFLRIMFIQLRHRTLNDIFLIPCFFICLCMIYTRGLKVWSRGLLNHTKSGRIGVAKCNIGWKNY